MTERLAMCWRGSGALGLLFLGASLAMADAGDVHRVTAERVNLRAGPSNDASIRSTVAAGDELIELQREGAWLGVRILGTGEEGWIYGELVSRVSQSQLSRASTAESLDDLSRNFGKLIARVDDQLGYRVVDRVERLDTDALRVVVTREWLLRAGDEAHLMTALAFYEMWRNHQDNRPVSLSLVTDRNENYLTIKDEEDGPVVTIQ